MAGNGRGIIRNRAYANQLHDFSGLKFGKITPTNIDGLIEYRAKGYVFLETKHKDAELPFGQRLALERLCDDLQKVKPTLLVVASHDTAGDIDVAQTEVLMFRFQGQWHPREGTTGQLVAAFIAYLDEPWSVGAA